MTAPRTLVLPARATVAALVVAAAAVLTPLSLARADPNPRTPTQQEVDAARQAVANASESVARLDASYAAAGARLEQSREQAANAAELSNGAEYALGLATRAATDAAARAASTRAAAEDAVEEARDLAAQAYQGNGSLGEVGALLEVGGPDELADRLSTLDLVAGLRRDLVARATAQSNLAVEAQRAAARAQAQERAAAAAARAAAATARAALATAHEEAQRVGAEQQAMLLELAALRRTSTRTEQARQDGLAAEAERRRVAEEERRRRAEEERRKRELMRRSPTVGVTPDRPRPSTSTSRPSQPTPSSTAPRPRPSTSSPPPRPSTSSPPPRPSTSRTTSTPTPTHSDPPPPPKAGAEAAAAYARAQLGKWYEWGGAGPDRFDCSGLTMMAWRQAGVYLTHYTGAQWSETRRIPIADLRSGDLVFFGDSGPTSHHMGLYIGDGQMIEAPYTGAQVRIRSIYRDDLIPYGGRP